MNRWQRAFTLVELLVVIAIIGILISLMLSGIQAARESARRAQCLNNVTQLIIGVHNYEAAFRRYPAGTIEPQGPIQNVNKGYHHGWLTQVLPYIEQRATYHHLDRTVSVYDPKNGPIRDMQIRVFQCPSSQSGEAGHGNYAGNHHDVESPINTTNNGIFFLNSNVRYIDVVDGASQTIYIGEKLPDVGDLGWVSGTRASLRNTGTPINAIFSAASQWRPKGGPPSQSGAGYYYDPNMSPQMGMMGAGGMMPPDGAEAPLTPNADSSPVPSQPMADEPSMATSADEQSPRKTNLPPIFDGRPTTATAVGGYESDHVGGAHFSFGDGSVRFLSEAIDMNVFQQLGHRADGKLLNQDF